MRYVLKIYFCLLSAFDYSVSKNHNSLKLRVLKLNNDTNYYLSRDITYFDRSLVFIFLVNIRMSNKACCTFNTHEHNVGEKSYGE